MTDRSAPKSLRVSTKPATVAAGLAVMILLATACGSGSSKSDSTYGGAKDTGTETTERAATDNPPVALPGTTTNHGTAGAKEGLEVELDDFYFGPTFVKATGGQRFTIELKNEGKAAHTFTSTQLGLDEQLAPGAEKTVTVTAPASGFVEFHCRFHQSQGMQGAIFVG